MKAHIAVYRDEDVDYQLVSDKWIQSFLDSDRHNFSYCKLSTKTNKKAVNESMLKLKSIEH